MFSYLFIKILVFIRTYVIITFIYRYNQGTGKIICRVSGTFGRAGWTLPPMDIEHPLTMEGVKWFAYFFLDGQVCPKLKRFVPSLLTTPGSITKSWAK